MILDEKKSKQEAGQLGEELDAMGQENEAKAAKWVIEKGKEEQKEQANIEATERQLLEDKRKYEKNPYFTSLYELARRRLHEYDVQRGYKVDVLLKENKILFGLQKVGYRWYCKGMTICGDPKYDINCVERMVIQTMLSLDELVEQHEKHRTKSGIILPQKMSL